MFNEAATFFDIFISNPISDFISFIFSDSLKFVFNDGRIKRTTKYNVASPFLVLKFITQ